MNDPNKLLTMAEAAERLSIDKRTLLQHIRDGRLRYINVGAGDLRESRRFRPEDIEAFIEAQTRGGHPPVVAGKPYRRRAGTSVTSPGDHDPRRPRGIRALLADQNATFKKR